MTVNKPMTGEQLDELMTVAVNMQRDSEKANDRPAAMFAYAVQVAVLELRNVRNDAVVLEQKLAESQREFRAADATIDSGNAYADPLREVTPLYTAPPAPVSVPAAMEMDDDFDSSFEHGKAVGWNAYRAVMLQGADSNSPVIPDGWVACSERMPETDGNYWGWWSESKRQGPVWFMKSDLQAQFQSSEITHWMPLPAAPLQEVKP